MQENFFSIAIFVTVDDDEHETMSAADNSERKYSKSSKCRQA